MHSLWLRWVLSRNLSLCVAPFSITIFVYFDWQHHVFISENTQMIHRHQPEVGRLSCGHLDLENCESASWIKASRTFMLKVGADLLIMCFFPSHSLTIWAWWWESCLQSVITCSFYACATCCAFIFYVKGVSSRNSEFPNMRLFWGWSPVQLSLYPVHPKTPPSLSHVWKLLALTIYVL